jgi:hypothetical protein
VAGAEAFSFRAAAVHVGRDAGAVRADVGASGVLAGEQPVFSAARIVPALKFRANCCYLYPMSISSNTASARPLPDAAEA